MHINSSTPTLVLEHSRQNNSLNALLRLVLPTTDQVSFTSSRVSYLTVDTFSRLVKPSPGTHPNIGRSLIQAPRRILRTTRIVNGNKHFPLKWQCACSSRKSQHLHLSSELSPSSSTPTLSRDQCFTNSVALLTFLRCNLHYYW